MTRTANDTHAYAYEQIIKYLNTGGSSRMATQVAVILGLVVGKLSNAGVLSDLVELSGPSLFPLVYQVSYNLRMNTDTVSEFRFKLYARGFNRARRFR